MSESMRGRVPRPHEVTVVLVGDSGTGKTALATRFCEDVFIQNYAPTTFNRYISEARVGSRRVRYTIWDTSGSPEPNTNRTLVCREADVFLLCYKISDPASLFSAINYWVPEVRVHAPATPIVLVGCQGDLRTDRSVIQALAKMEKSLVSPQQALAMSQQVQAVMYIETSAKTSIRSVASLMEVAALTSFGQISPTGGCGPDPPPSRSSSPPPPPVHHRQSSLNIQTTPSPLISKKQRNRSLSVTRQRHDMLRNSFKPGDSSLLGTKEDSLLSLEPAELFWDQFDSSKEGLSPKGDSPLSSRQSQGSPRSPILTSRAKMMGSLSSVSMRSKSSTLSSTKSDSSMQSYTHTRNTISITTKTPKQSRKSPDKDKVKTERMVTIKCQRLTADRTYEEVEIEVPAPVYETMQNYSENGSVSSRSSKEKRGLGTKIKCLFSKTTV